MTLSSAVDLYGWATHSPQAMLHDGVWLYAVMCINKEEGHKAAWWILDEDGACSWHPFNRWASLPNGVVSLHHQEASIQARLLARLRSLRDAANAHTEAKSSMRDVQGCPDPQPKYHPQGWGGVHLMDNIPAWLIDLLREARDTVQASTAEEGITHMRREYREGLGDRLDRACRLLRDSLPQEDIMRSAMDNLQPKES